MLLSIDHQTSYRYEHPQRRIVQSFRMTPAECESQQVMGWSVEVEGACFGASFTDGGGDLVQTMTLSGPASTIDVKITGTVRTFDTAGVLKGHQELNDPGLYLRETSLTRVDDAIRELAAETACEGALDTAHAFTNLVAERIVYAPGSTAHGHTAIDTLQAGQGVCQDQSHLLIALARSAGIPARYVTGYLLTDAEGKYHEASHAWTELFVDGLGWVGLDPTNRCCPDERYVRLGSGLDAQEAAPIRGVSFGHGTEIMDVAVTVMQMAQQ